MVARNGFGVIEDARGFSVPRFRIGDRVQVVGDIARFYACPVGIIVQGESDTASVLNQHTVRLADGTAATFFDFQLQTPPAVTAHLIFDSSTAPKGAGARGTAGRQLRLLARNVDIHLRISDSPKKTIIGQITTGATAVQNALVTLLIGDQIRNTTSTDAVGEFTLSDVASGEVKIEIVIPSRKILASLTV